MGDGSAEHRHNSVADEFLDGRAVRHKDLSRPGERVRERLTDYFGVIRAGRAARIDDVREQDGHDLPFLRHVPESRSRC